MNERVVVIGCDPAKTCGLAAIIADQRCEPVVATSWAMDLKSLPCRWGILDELARDVYEWELYALDVSAPHIKGWHWACEEMFAGVNQRAAMADQFVAGQVYQAFGRTWASHWSGQAVIWRAVLGKQASKLPRKEAKAAAIAYCQRTYNLTCDPDAAEALCIASYRLEQLRRERKDAQLGIVGASAHSKGVRGRTRAKGQNETPIA
ncbi:hypothetical protein HQ590_07145 [bacterium]|nr:hypothetical protein [bacterium]